MTSTKLIQKHPRYPVTLHVQVDRPGFNQPITCETANISLGGVFLKTDQVLAPNTVIQLLVRPESELLYTWARVVHVMDPARGAKVDHPVGLGVEFAPLDPTGRARLELFLTDVSKQTQALKDKRKQAEASRSAFVHRRSPRYVGGVSVGVRTGEDQVPQQLWLQDISRGGLYVVTDVSPPLGTKVEVIVPTSSGTLSLWARIVRIVTPDKAAVLGCPPGAGMQFEELGDVELKTIEALLAKRVPTMMLPPTEPEPVKPDLPQIALALGRLFDGLDRGDFCAALGLPPGTGEAEIRARVAELRQLLATPPQRAPASMKQRMTDGSRALERLEAKLDQPAPPPAPPPATETAAVEAEPVVIGDVEEQPGVLIRQARALEQHGQHGQAWETFQQAEQQAGDTESFAEALAADLAGDGLVAQRELAEKLLKQADQLIRYQQHDEALKPLRQAAQLIDALGPALDAANAGEVRKVGAVELWVPKEESTDLRREAVRMLAECDEYTCGARIARAVVSADPKSVMAWDYLLEAYGRAGHRRLAQAAADRLRQLQPNDKELPKRLKKLLTTKS